jgi:hypothetical protein
VPPLFFHRNPSRRVPTNERQLAARRSLASTPPKEITTQLQQMSVFGLILSPGWPTELAQMSMSGTCTMSSLEMKKAPAETGKRIPDMLVCLVLINLSPLLRAREHTRRHLWIWAMASPCPVAAVTLGVVALCKSTVLGDPAFPSERQHCVVIAKPPAGSPPSLACLQCTQRRWVLAGGQ